MLAGERSLFAENGLRTLDPQDRLGHMSIKWNWSHHQFEFEFGFETELFSARRPADFVDLMRCRFLRWSKRHGYSNIRPSPIRPTVRGQSPPGQFFGAA